MKRTFFNSTIRLFFVAALLLVTKISFGQNTIVASPDDTICPGGSATLTATVTIGANGVPGTGLNLGDDNWSGVIPLGFNFTFFGNTYSNIVVGSNNILTFDVSQANGGCPWPITAAIPTSADPMNSIMCPWEDLFPNPNSEVYATIGTAPNRIFVVSYCSSPMYLCTNMLFTGSVMLYEGTNVIETHTSDKFICPSNNTWNGDYAIHGIQNSTGTVAYFVPGRNYPSVWTASNDGYRWTPTGPGTYSGSVIPYSPIILNVPTTAVNWYNGSTLVGTGNTITVSPNVTTQYVAEFGSCSGVVSDTVNVVVETITVDAGPDDTICPGSPVQLNATSPDPITGWTWSPTTALNNPNIANPIASPTVTTVYTVTGSNGNCTTSDDITIVVSNNSGLTYTSSQTNLTCNSNCNGTATVDVTAGNGPFTYLWAPSGGTDSTATNLCSGTYSCTISSAVGCSSTQSFVITAPPPITASLSTAVRDCDTANGTATVNPSGGSPPYTYLWSNGQTTQTATGLDTGTYAVTITDVNSCPLVQTVVVGEAVPPVATVTALPPGYVLGGSSQITAGTGDTYLWSPTTNLSCTNCPNPIASPPQTTTYCVVVSDTASRCADTTCITIDVEIPCTSGGLDKLLPNAFSPNSDGVNDEFCIPNNACILTFNLKIYDRWGEKVFESNSMTNCWDGTYKGEMLNRGLYVYYFDAKLSTGDEYHRQGNISLLK